MTRVCIWSGQEGGGGRSALARQPDQEGSEAIRHLSQRLNVLLAKGNTILKLNQVLTFKPKEIDGQWTKLATLSCTFFAAKSVTMGSFRHDTILH